jgi:histidinol-phosphate aminotransferase
METGRRLWLKQIGLGIAGIGLANLPSFASPAQRLIQLTDSDVPVRLSSNENPYGPSPLARKAMMEYIATSNRYNWQITRELVEALAQKNKVTADNILMGAGSTEIIDLVARFAAREKGSLLIADPSYGYWTETAEKSGLKKISVPLTAQKQLDLDTMLKAIKQDTRLIYVCNPNNPTGTICGRDALIEFINEATKKTIVLVDEAYLDFTTQPSVSTLVAANKNLIVAKTFSKIYGLAGARVGYGIGHTSTMAQLSELSSWVNGSISVVSTAAALASLKDEQFLSETYALNEKAKQYTMKELKRLNINCIPSATNFLYFSLANYRKDFFEQLKSNHITGTKIYEEEGLWTRITIGNMQEMQTFIKAIA